MNPAYNLSSSASSFHFLDLDEDYIPEYEYYGSTTNQSLLAQQAPSSSSTCPAFFNLAQGYHSESHLGDYPQTSQKVNKKIALVEGSNAGDVFSASFYQRTDGDSTNDLVKMVGHGNRIPGIKDDGSVKWMSSKIRAMRRMLHSTNSSETKRYMPAKSNNATNQFNSVDYYNSSSAEIVRVCSDCKTTKTPLWRGGPQGPKSLCNACGIRRRKARKAMALAAEAAQSDTDRVDKMVYHSSRIHKEKKPRTSYHDVTQSSQTTAKPKLSFEDFAMSLINKKSTKLFPRDEEEAAILLMALSCGLIHS